MINAEYTSFCSYNFRMSVCSYLFALTDLTFGVAKT
jgi:hypothetical protein